MHATIAGPERFYSEMKALSFQPGWSKQERTLWPSPKRTFHPHAWHYETARAALTEASGFISTEQAERRNLVMVNPMEGNAYATTRNLVAAYQLVMPGDVARSHRHTANALRIIVDAPPDTYTIVNGTRLEMTPGDILLTPNWLWHGHANEGDRAACWIDVLDVPLLHHLESIFFEHYEQTIEPVREVDPASRFRISAAEAVRKAEAPDRDGDARVVEVGQDLIDTIGFHVFDIPAGGETGERKATNNALYTVVSGAVSIPLEDGTVFELRRGDVMAMPSWTGHRLRATEDAVVIQVSDIPVYKKLGFYRTAQGAKG